MKPIIHTPNQILVTPSRQVGKIDKKVKSIISEMKDTLIRADNPKGVGLAAPQIGISLRIFITRPKETDNIFTFINPKIIWISKKLVKGIPSQDNQIEGCLSLPNVWGIVERHESVKLEYVDEKNNIKQESFSGFPAIIVQHEIDHLDGILFSKRVLEQKGELFKAGKDEKGKEILVPLEI